MRVVKRSDMLAPQQPEPMDINVCDIPLGTVFSGCFPGFQSGVYYKFSDGACRLAYGSGVECDGHVFSSNLIVFDYEKLDVTLVIEDCFARGG